VVRRSSDEHAFALVIATDHSLRNACKQCLSYIQAYTHTCI